MTLNAKKPTLIARKKRRHLRVTELSAEGMKKSPVYASAGRGAKSHGKETATGS